jgi:glycosyltransferase involved in cell wall biosynthesis
MSILSCGIVSLEKGLMGTCAPSKYYSYLQSGCAIISVTEKDSYIALETEKEKIGYHIALGDGERLAETLTYLSENRSECEEMGRRAKRLYEERYSKDRAMKQYSSLLDTLLN